MRLEVVVVNIGCLLSFGRQTDGDSYINQSLNFNLDQLIT